MIYTMKRFRFPIVLAAFLTLVLFAGLSAAQAGDADLMPPYAAAAMAPAAGTDQGVGEATHPDLSIMPDTIERIKLDGKVDSIIIGNPAHLSVQMEDTQTLLLAPGAPGATNLTVLGQDGTVLMQRHVLVTAPQENYVRIRRSCSIGDSKNCEETSVFYCPGACHEVSMGEDKKD